MRLWGSVVPKGVYSRRPREPKAYPAELVARVRELYASGHTQAEIGAHVGVSQKVVFLLMRRHSIARRLATPRDQRGQNNANWRGDEAGYQAFHRRLYSMFGKPSQCSECGTVEAEHYDYANLTGNYYDPADYRPMCRSCHWRHDQKVLNISHMREKLRA